MRLNNRFASYNVWNMYYGMNPDRWYYDRFYALERILGPNVFIVFQQRYYNGFSPVVYFQNYRRNYYVVNFNIRPKYKYVNTNRYRVYKIDFKNSWQNTRNVAMLDTKATSPIRSGQNGDVRNTGMISSNSQSNQPVQVSSTRNVQNVRETGNARVNNGGALSNVRSTTNNIRSSNASTPIRNTSSMSSGSTRAATRTIDSGVRMSSQSTNSNMRSSSSAISSGSRSGGERISR